MTWGPVKIAIVCGGAEGRAAVERRVRERGFEVHSWRDFIDDLLRPGRTIFDYETRCEVSLDDMGAWKYAAHPSNEIMCVGWSHRPDTERTFVAHNIGFEEAISGRHIPRWSEARWFKWSCTASRARRLGLPGGLKGACNVMRTPHRKSEEGHRIMLQVSQPRPLWANRGQGQKWFEDADRLAENAVYCGQDIYAERDLDDVLPELTPFERAVWEQVERGNRRGLRLDVDLIGAMEQIVDGEEARVLAEVRSFAGADFSLTAPAAVREFCARRGVHMGDLTAATVEGVLAGHRSGARPVDPWAAKVLEGRQAVAKSSNAKLPAMQDRLQEDGFARDYAIFHGAHTGRATGAKVNPLNLPRPYNGYDQDQVVAAIRDRDLVRMEQMGVMPSRAVSASLRGTIIAPEGKTFVIGDYSSIEPCALFTLAGQWDAVKVLRDRGNLYCEFGTSSNVFGKPVTKKEIVEYTISKQVVLGCGYGLGGDGFVAKLKAEGIDVPEQLARAGHAAYKPRFPQVKHLWNGLEEAAKAAIRNVGQKFAYGSISYIFDGYWLVAFMPNGNPMFYPNARLQPGKFSDEIVYEGRLKGGAWGDVRTWGGSLTENKCQKISREITMEDKLELEHRYGWHVPLDVYDEIVAECDENEVEPLDKMYAVMRRQRAWLPQMPVWAEGFVAKRYRKD